MFLLLQVLRKWCVTITTFSCGSLLVPGANNDSTGGAIKNADDDFTISLLQNIVEGLHVITQLKRDIANPQVYKVFHHNRRNRTSKNSAAHPVRRRQNVGLNSGGSTEVNDSFEASHVPCEGILSHVLLRESLPLESSNSSAMEASLFQFDHGDNCECVSESVEAVGSGEKRVVQVRDVMIQTDLPPLPEDVKKCIRELYSVKTGRKPVTAAPEVVSAKDSSPTNEKMRKELEKLLMWNYWKVEDKDTLSYIPVSITYAQNAEGPSCIICNGADVTVQDAPIKAKKRKFADGSNSSKQKTAVKAKVIPVELTAKEKYIKLYKSCLYEFVCKANKVTPDEENNATCDHDGEQAPLQYDFNEEIMQLLNDYDISKVKEGISEALRFHEMEEIMGYKPVAGKKTIPMTPKGYCGHCGEENKRTDSHCGACEHRLKTSIDYGALTDALVWCYVFRDIGIDMHCHNGEPSLMAIIEILPIVRSYYGIDELGHDFFKLQCYFITHLLYVFSDWGQHPLCRELFAEEFEFIANNMNKVIVSLKDPELVGEFLHCLKILQLSPYEDAEMWNELIIPGYKFLIELEASVSSRTVRQKTKLRAENSKSLGEDDVNGMDDPDDAALAHTYASCSSTRGKWVRSGKLYDNYHATYCATIGLLDYNYCPYIETTVPRITPFKEAVEKVCSRIVVVAT